MKAHLPSAVATTVVACLILHTPAHAASEPASFPAQTTSPQGAAHLYLLAFADQPVAQVAGQVLGVVLQTPFEIDPAITGKMSLVVEERLTRDQLLGVFEAALARSGVAISRAGGTLKLIPLTTAPPPSASARRPTGRLHRGGEVVSSALLYGGAGSATTTTASSAPKSGRDPWMVATLALVGLGGLAAVLAAAALFARRTGVSFGRLETRSPRQAVLARVCEASKVDAPTLAAARATAAESGRPVEHVLNGMGAVSDDALVAAYAAVTGLPVWLPEEQPPLLWASDIGLQAEDLTRRGLVPVLWEPGRLTLATSDPLDDEGLAGVALEMARTVAILVCTPADVRRAIAAV